MLLKEIHLSEARNPKLTYTEKKVKGQLDRVILSLEGNQASKFTRLISRYKKLQKGVVALQEEQNKLNGHLKDEVETLFDASDEVYTRVIETISATLTLSKKQSSTTSKTDYAQVIADLIAMVPELEDKINKLIEEHTKVTTTEKAPALRTTIKEGVKEWIAKIKQEAKEALKAIRAWGKEYDKKLADLNAQIQAIK